MNNLKKILIIGAGSAIAIETAKKFAAQGTELYLADVTSARLSAVKDHINTFHKTTIHLKEFNAMNFRSHQDLLDEAVKIMGRIDGVLIAYGTLPDQETIRNNAEKAVFEFNLNGTSVISLSTIAAAYFEKQNKGTLAVISSVAGDRGRQSNYIYGSAKGAVSLFLEGMRNRLNESNVNIITIKPGMVDTPMTAHLPKNPLFSKPEIIGDGIFKAMTNGKDTVYLPPFWRFVMLVIKHIPEFIFKKMKL